MSKLPAEEAQSLIDAAEDEQLMLVAVHLAAAANRMYSDGDCCPMCGYDAYWDMESARQSALETYAMLTQAMAASKDNGYADLRVSG